MEGLTFRIFLVVQMVAVLILLFVLAVWPGPWNLQRTTGSVLALAGMIGVFTARYQLGRSFSVTPQARALVTHGLYSKIRNPIYVFGTIAVAGVVLALHLRWGWILLAVLIAVQVLRARREARVLEAKFGDEYRRYRSQTWF
jgi:protein-S-isoprenylcysteine O-methyltransferase Ste14